MISYIKGKVLHKTPSSVVVLNGDIGYEIALPASRLFRYSLQQEIELYTYQYVREDALQLYGFDSWEEREIFLLLLNVSGVGPKGALAMVGQSTVSGLCQAIAEENMMFLTKMPGIGKKTAQRLILELKDKLPQMEFNGSLPVDSPIVEDSTNANKDDIYAVLMSLGYHESEIRRIYPQLKETMDSGDEQAVVKKALQLLAKI